MKAKFIKIASALAVVGLLSALSLTAAFAAAPTGSGPESALAPAGEWMPLEVGAAHWYTFNYDGGQGQINVVLNVDPQNGATFAVHTPEMMVQRSQGADVEPIGRGSANDALAGDLNWSGNFNTAGAYYVVVESANPSGTSYYALEASGDGVYMPMAAADSSDMTESMDDASVAASDEVAMAADEPTATAEPVADDEPVAVAEPVADDEPVAAAPADADAGTGPDNALTASGEWMPIASGQDQWYAFSVSGSDAAIKVMLDSDSGNVTFSVWTPEQVARGGPYGNDDPIGRGSANEFESADLFWTGQFNNAGTYYVVVSNSGSPASYALTIAQ